MTAPVSRTTEEITVRRCTVTVVRHGGWSWGPDPKGLVDRALDALPELLADHFADRLTGEGPDTEITEPVTVTVRARADHGSGSAAPLLDVRVTAPPEPVPAAVSPAGTPGDDPTPFDESLAAAGLSWSPPAVAALFAELSERRELDALLALLPDTSVRVYLLALLRADEPAAALLLTELARRAAANGPAPTPNAPADPADAATPAAAASTAPDAPAEDDLLALARLLVPLAGSEDLTALARLLAGHAATALVPPPTGAAHRPTAAPLPEAVDATPGQEDGVLPGRTEPGPAAERPPADARPGSADHGPEFPRTAGHETADGRAAGGLAPTARGEARVGSVLPFLLAGPLARIGYLDALGPALAGVELAEEASLFAAALAYKVLGATGRGWRRAERDSETAAVFAGLDPPVPEERLTRFARLVGPALPVLDGVLALAVCRGHDPADPLLITGAGDRLLLVDAQGLFPVAFADRAAELLPYWRLCGSPPVLICEGPLPPGTFGELAAAGVPFLTRLRPLRGDPVRRLPGRTPVWSARGAPPDPRLAAALPGHTARLTELARALVDDRRAVPLAEDGGLERCVTLAAALGLSTVAWTLWRDRETPDPLAALLRFADLDATVRFGPEAVRVRIPLGRRHADLLRSGLLADVPDVVWLGGRSLTFSGG
ncbi:hypothetical protein GCM10010387_37980 [Streptomyces inusitatus]|uniref:Uncharacterized protein n=1 Tax=Streptomyces inusitatus TaxID=68221 RepID=A0A918QCS4_9ACTN|nr:hypothetical protein [Streptomyces inusitatus]GGZ40016.1 hypothetical protein GCM10010387_37980 [Streptomyces inusitatus]